MFTFMVISWESRTNCPFEPVLGMLPVPVEADGVPVLTAEPEPEVVAAAVAAAVTAAVAEVVAAPVAADVA